jgi:hypothetical protein
MAWRMPCFGRTIAEALPAICGPAGAPRPIGRAENADRWVRMITPALATSSSRSRTPWHWCIPILALLSLTSCLVIISPSSTTIAGATIVFVAADHGGAFVSSLHVTVVDVAGPWRSAGITGRDGSFRCDVRSGVTRVRAEVAPPAGYMLPMSEPWPRHLDLTSGGSVRVEVRVTAR